MQRPEPSSIPEASGVYLYKDAQGTIIYIGKARVLRKRVLSYFRKDVSPKTAAMLSHAVSVEFLTTCTEKEALLLEASLIKRHHPHYNIALRDDKQYFLFRIDERATYPRLEIVRSTRRDGARYFGPFSSALAARDTWKLLHRTFGLRRCTDRAMKNRVRPCLYFHLKQCLAPCQGKLSKATYQAAVTHICQLLDGHADSLVQELTQQMEAAAETLAFEEAARLRDQIRAIRQTVEQQAVILPGQSDTDVIGLHESEKGMDLGILFVRNGSVAHAQTFYWPGLHLEDAEELITSFLSQFYAIQLPPSRILLPVRADLATAGQNAEQAESSQATLQEKRLPQKRDEAQSGKIPVTWENENVSELERTLSARRGAPVSFVLPKDEVETKLIAMAVSNAREDARRTEQHQNEDILSLLQKALKLPRLPRRIECVDVSHTQGQQTRVGMIVYQDGVPSRHDYRVYAMPDSKDDYATLSNWIPLRIKSGPPFPDLLLIDGGLGQLACVERALTDLDKKELFPCAGIAKARKEDGQPDRRAGNVNDKIFLPNRSNPLPLRAGSAELLFLQQIRNTAHHFAIQRHRAARQKTALSGDLMCLPGIGPSTARLLWDKFGTLAAMRAASCEELAELSGVGKKRALKLLNALKNLPVR